MKAIIYRVAPGVMAVEFDDSKGKYAALSDFFLQFPMLGSILLEAKEDFDYANYKDTFEDQESPEVIQVIGYGEEDAE